MAWNGGKEMKLGASTGPVEVDLDRRLEILTALVIA